MALTVALAVSLLTLGFLAQLTGILTVRARLTSLNFATPEDNKSLKSKHLSLDLKIFLFLLKYLCCLCGRASPPEDEEAVREKEKEQEAKLERWKSIHRHATENNATVGMLYVSLYLAQQRCLMAESCDPNPVVTQVFIYLYLAARLLHFLIYIFAIRQPYRAIAFISTNVCMTAVARQIITWLFL